MVQASLMKEVERLKQNLLLQGQKLDAAQQRVAELETQLSKKEHLIAEQKKFLEDVKGQAKYGCSRVETTAIFVHLGRFKSTTCVERALLVWPRVDLVIQLVSEIYTS